MTPAVSALERAGQTFEIVTYDHDPSAPSYGAEAADVLGLDPSVVFKTLMVELDTGELVVAVVPVACQLDLKAIARAAGAKRATMADLTLAERRTGYVAGGISPFGQRMGHQTFVDESAELWDQVHVSGGRRGMEVAIAPATFATVLDAVFCDLT